MLLTSTPSKQKADRVIREIALDASMLADIGEYPVKRLENLVDGNPDSYVDGGFFGAGQVFTLTLPQPITLARIDVDGQAWDLDWAHFTITWPGGSMSGQQRTTLTRKGEWANVQVIRFSGYPRERYFSCRVFEWVEQ